MSDQAVRANAIVRGNLYYFARKAFQELYPGETLLDNWHIRSMVWHLEQCSRGNIKRLIITVPPRHLKSFLATVAFPAWVLGQDPTSKIITASYAQPLANEHTRLFQDIVQSEWYPETFPETTLQSGQNRANEQITTANGYRKATSVGGSLTGMGGNCIILDDVIKPEDAASEVVRSRTNEWYSNTLISRLNNPSEDVIIAVMQRTHVHDFIGHITDLGDWEILNIPAIATERMEYRTGDDPADIHVRDVGEVIDPRRQTVENLAETREAMGERHFQAQYQQQPLPEEGNLLKRQWFKTIKPLEEGERYDQIVISWDTATDEGRDNDYSVATVWGIRGYDFDLLDVYRAKLNYPDLYYKAVELVELHNADFVLVENASSGIPLYQELRSELDIRVKAMKPFKSKYLRMDQQSIFLERGQVHLPDEAAWLGEFLSEVLAFPNSKHDDQIDSLQQFLQFMRWRRLLRRSQNPRQRNDPHNRRRNPARRNIARRSSERSATIRARSS